MKKTAIIVLFCLIAFDAKAQKTVPYLEEVEALGYIAGQGMACKALKYDTFEMLARAIIITKAASDAEQAVGVRAYNDSKASAYLSKRMDGFFECALINRRFDAQGIFDIRLYADGTIDMPDGTVYTPRVAYDATLLYDKENNGVKEAGDIYEKTAKNEVKAAPLEIKSGVPPRRRVTSGERKPTIVTPSGSYEMPDATTVQEVPSESTVGRISRKK